MPDQDYSFMPDGGGESDWHYLDAYSYNPLSYSGGQLPWAMEWIFDNIVQYLKDENWVTAAQLMGAVCHFTGDSTNPLHATWNYDPGGHHSDYEHAVNNHLSEISIPDNYVPQYLDDITNAALATLAESFSFTAEGSGGGVNLTDFLYSGIFWNDWIKSMSENRVRAAVQFTANVWYTAMIQAGFLLPPSPSLISPENGAYLSDNIPTFVWASVSYPGGVTYQIQIDDNSNFSSPVYFAIGIGENTHTLPDENALALGTYFWRVRAADNMENVGDWSSVWTLSISPKVCWTQTDWKGGPTKPPLQVGTWNNTYDNFYDNYKVDWSQAGKVRLKASSGSQQLPENIAPPAADSYVSSSNPSINYGTLTYFYVGYRYSGANRGYLKFDLSSIPSNTMIVQAKLWVYNYIVSGSANIQVERVDNDSWTESGITWNNQPARTSILVGPQSIISGTTWYSWTSSTLASFVTAQYAGDKIVSLAMIDTGENSGSSHYARFNSKEYGSGEYAPMLEVTYLNSVYENGWFESSIFNAGKVVDWKNVGWNENKPSGANIVVKVRTGSDNDPYDGGWSDWCQHDNNTENASLPNNRYVQYRVELSTTDNTKTPELFDITISYNFDNMPPPTPSLVSPLDGEIINDNTPTLVWTSVSDPSGVTYNIQVDNDSSFPSPEVNVTGLVDNTYTSPALAYGNYSWRVRAVDGAGNVGNWSEVWQFQISRYLSRGRIYIRDNENFTSANGVTDGSGTESDPYIIEGWEINALVAGRYWDGAIDINETNAYFIIQNCYIHGGRDNVYSLGSAIKFADVWHGTIRDTVIGNVRTGILVYDNGPEVGVPFSAFNVIDSNVIENSNAGINIYGDPTSYIMNNTVRNVNSSGIALTGSMNIIVQNNVVDNVHASSGFGGGIWIAGGAENILVENNKVANSGPHGMDIYYCYNIMVRYNNVENSAQYGFRIKSARETDNVMIYMNNIRNSGQTPQAWVNYQNFFENVAWDNGSHGNYWSDWTTPDVNHNGIVDNKYILAGAWGNWDNYPLTQPYENYLSGGRGRHGRAIEIGRTLPACYMLILEELAKAEPSLVTSDYLSYKIQRA